MGRVAVKALPQSDALSLEQLKELLHSGEPPCVSLYMPAHRADSQVQQNAVRFRNLIREASDRLHEYDLDPHDADEVLAPARRLAEDSPFWQHQSDGLAVFLCRDWARAYRLPVRFAEQTIVNSRFYIKPLLPYFMDDGLFYVLTLSQHGVRFFRASRHGIDELGLEHVPRSMGEALHYEAPAKEEQFHPVTPRAGKAGITQGHGAEAEDTKDDIRRYFHRVDKGVCEHLRDSRAPLVLAGVEYLLPLYRQANRYPHLLEAGVPVNAQALQSEEIHAKVWPAVEPAFEQRLRNAADKYDRYSGEGRRSSQDTAEIVKAAYQGRVESLFVAEGEQQWGAFDPAALEVRLHRERQPGDEDLTDYAAAQTLLTRGAIYVMEPRLVPDRSTLSAVLRY